MCHQNPTSDNNNNMKRPSSSSRPSSRPPSRTSRRASHHQDISLVQRAAYELEKLKRSTTNNCNKSSSTSSSSCDGQPGFPFACRQLLRKIPGNDRCVDCGCRNNPDWASVTYGVLMCVQCSGKHRSYGVNISRVRSINMDSWNHKQVMAMLEGGNMQLNKFCERHQLMLLPSSSTSSSSSSTSSDSTTRYHTKAAKFYRTHLSIHIEKLFINKGTPYKGRQIARTSTSCSSKSNNTDRDSKNASEDVNATTTTTSSPSSCCNNPTTTTTTTTTTPIHYHHHPNVVVVSDVVVPITTTNRLMVITARVA